MIRISKVERNRKMRYKGSRRIKALIAAGILTVSLSGCNRKIQGYSSPTERTEIAENAKENTEQDRKIGSIKFNAKKIERFKEKLQEDFKALGVTLDKTSDQFVSSIVIDGTNVTIELVDGSQVSGTLYSLQISDVNFENFYIYNSQYIEDFYNSDEVYQNYKEQGYRSSFEALSADYNNHAKLRLETKNCSVNDEYKRGDIYYDIDWYGKIDYSKCKKLWLTTEYLRENEFSDMPNLETLVLIDARLTYLDEEVIKISSDSLKNLIIDGKDVIHFIDYFDLTGCPNLEVVSLPNNSQETNLDGLKGLRNLKQFAFGMPETMKYEIERLISKDFQDRIDLISEPIPSDHSSLSKTLRNFISDISGINGSAIEILNISFFKRVSSDRLLETVKSLPNLKQIIGFEVNNAGMCSDELIEYCEENGISHPFTEKSLKIKHKLQDIVSSEITEDMSEEEKIWALSKYIMEHMEYSSELVNHTNKESDEIKKGWGESLYYSVIEGEGVCEGYATYAQNLFTEAGINSYKIDGAMHTWNLVEIDDEYYYVDLTNLDALLNLGLKERLPEDVFDEMVSSYYLSPVEEEWHCYTYELPIEAEKKANEGKEEREAREQMENSRVESIEVGKYMLQANREELSKKDYSSLCGTIGILCALGLAKKVGDKKEKLRQTEMLVPTTSLEDKESVKKIGSLKEVLKALKRMEKEDKLRSRRDIADSEKTKNKKAKILEEEALHFGREEDIR